LRSVTIYRDTYKTLAINKLPGVWTAKDLSTHGPFAFSLEIENQTNNLATVDWDFRSGLLDNLFPITEFAGPNGRFIVRLLTFAPVSADGTRRLRGIVYGLQLENKSSSSLSATVVLPTPPSVRAPYYHWAQSDEYGGFELGLGDSPAFSPRVPVKLQPGESRWVSVIVCAPDEGVVRDVNKRGTINCLLESQHYYRRLLGHLTTPAEPFLAEFYERSVMQALQCLAESANGRIAGASWGSFPVTRLNWTKDMYYSALPFTALDPALAVKMILWFDTYGVRPESMVLRNDANSEPSELLQPVSHSVSLSVAAPLMAGVFFDRTGDPAPILQHPEWKANWARILDTVLATRKDADTWLFPTRFISDGTVSGDYHTGSNVCVWRALTAYARLLAEVWNDPVSARRYIEAAEKVKASLLARTVIAGPFGRQFIEATWRDRRPPKMVSDGEESDTTLIPFYGLLPYDDEIYLNYMRFSMSPYNVNYTRELESLSWESSIPSTAPGYSKGLCAGLDRESLFSDQGFFTTLRRVTDADGSVWWWPYGSGSFNRSKPGRASYLDVGKSAWSASVNALLIQSRFLGISYDAPRRELRFKPLTATGNFTWQDFPEGNDRFDVSFAETTSCTSATIGNLNNHSVTLDATLPVARLNSPFTTTVNGLAEKRAEVTRSFGQDAIHIFCTVDAKKTVELRIITREYPAMRERHTDLTIGN
jgi:hypothetical protein